MSVSHRIERRFARWWAAGVVSFLFITSAAGSSLFRQAQKDISERLSADRQNLAQNAATFVDGLIRQSITHQLTFIERQDRELRTADAKAVTQLLRDFSADSPLFSSGAVLIRGNNILATWPENPSVIGKNLTVEFEHLRTTLESGTTSVSGKVPSPIFFDQDSVEVASPILGEGQRVEGVLSSAFLVKGSTLQGYLEGLEAGPASSYVIVDRSGAPIAYPGGVEAEQVTFWRDKSGYEAAVATAGWRVVLTQKDRVAGERLPIGNWIIGLITMLLFAVAALGYLAYRFLRKAETASNELAEASQRVEETEKRFSDTEPRVAAIEQERSRDIERVEQLDAEKDEFVSMVSHELRGPLTIMKGWIEMILEGRFGELTDDQQEYLTISQNNIERMFALVEDLLTVSKAESGRLDMVPEIVLVSEVIDDLAANVEQIVTERGLQLAVEVDPDLPAIEADRHRIEQVITNFLSNAIKFTPEGGTVSIKARSEDGGVVAEVSDTGLGIPAGEQGDLFKKFFRTSNVKGRVPGTGLGLAISKAIVERHGGRVGLESVEGEGSTFWMWLPRTFRGAAPTDS